MNEVDKLKTILQFSDDNYYYGDKEYITNSMLSKLNQSPMHLQKYLDGEKDSSPALSFGSAFHTFILEPEKVDTIVVFEGKTRRGKAWDEFCIDNADKTIITSKEWETITNMSKVILNNEEAIDFIAHSHKEVVNIWDDTTRGIKCKGKVDCTFTASDNRKILVDIKTTKDSSIDSFRRTSWKYGYDRQAAFYMNGFDADEFWFIVIEKESPHRVGIYKASEPFLNEGRNKINTLMDLYHKYFVSKEEKINEFYFKGEL